MLFINVWWFISARKWFKGPKVNVDHAMLGREGNEIEGKMADNSSGDDVPVAFPNKDMQGNDGKEVKL